MTDVTICQNFPHPLLPPTPPTLGNHNARTDIFFPKVRSGNKKSDPEWIALKVEL